MKKKYLILIILIILIVLLNNNQDIRIRIIANSNSISDQQLKKDISNDIKNTLYDLLKDVKTKKEAKDIINNNIDLLDSVVYKHMKNIDYGYNINYGYHYFPRKSYNNEVYKEGMYESLLITLGNGEGDNWWCLLYPSFCLIEEENTESVQYTSYIYQIIRKIFN